MNDERVALITGGTDGVGKVTAMELARRGFTVVLPARDPAKGETVAREIAAATGNARTEIVRADLASFAQVRALAGEVLRRHHAIDVLVNNAGVFLGTRTETEDGLETSLQVNYLSHFLLTALLRDALVRSEQGRVVNVSSSVHAIASFDPDDLAGTTRFSAMRTYAATKLHVLMFTEELAQRMRGTRVTANAVHPGVVRTQMMLRAPGVLRIVSYLSLPFSISPERGARGPLHLATSPDLRNVTGLYFSGEKRAPVRNAHDTAENRALLWRLSEEATLGAARLRRAS